MDRLQASHQEEQFPSSASTSRNTGSISEPSMATTSYPISISPPEYHRYIEDDPVAVRIDKGAVPAIQEDIPEAIVNRVKVKSPNLYAFLIGMASFVCGLVLGFPSAVLSIPHNFPYQLTGAQSSWISWAALVTAAAGGLASGLFMDKVGRRFGLLLITFLMIIGWIVQQSSSTYECLMTGRIVAGLCLGLLSAICPVLTCEIAPTFSRGSLVTSNQLFLCLGMLFVNGFGDFLSWIWVNVACLVWSLILVVLVLPVPESPRWLYQQGRFSDSRQALQKIRGAAADVDGELAEYGTCLQGTRDRATIDEFRRPALYKPALLVFGLMVLRRLSGIDLIGYQSEMIFEKAGIDMEPNLKNCAMIATEIAGVLLCMVVVDTKGRGYLLSISAAIMMFCMAGMGTYFCVDMPENFYWLPITCLFLFLFAYNMGFGPLAWLMMSEMVPQRAKWLAVGVLTAVNWLLVFGMDEAWRHVSSSDGATEAYFVCCGFCGLSNVLIYFLPDKNGKSLEEIERSFNQRRIIHRAERAQAHGPPPNGAPHQN